jgi:hypothetical protein
MTVRIQVMLADIDCNDTEDVDGVDEIYLISAVAAGEVVQGTITHPVAIGSGSAYSIDPGQAEVFNGDVPPGKTAKGFVQVWDEDVAKDWANRPRWVDEVVSSIATGVTKAALQSGNPWAIGGAALLDLGVWSWYYIAPRDKDDNLGNFTFDIPTDGPQYEVRRAEVKGGQGWWSSWDYTITYAIRRWPVYPRIRVEPETIQVDRLVEVTVSAADAESEVTLDGIVRIGGREVGSLGLPFLYVFHDPTAGVVESPGYPPTSFPFPVALRKLSAIVEPYPVALDSPVIVTVRAEDADSHAPVSCEVVVNGARVGETNVPFAYTFRRRIIRGKDPDGIVIVAELNPGGWVHAPGYAHAAIDFGFPEPQPVMDDL